MIERKEKGFWTKEKVFEESKKYTVLHDFQKNAGSACAMAYKNNWINEMPWIVRGKRGRKPSVNTTPIIKKTISKNLPVSHHFIDNNRKEESFIFKKGKTYIINIVDIISKKCKYHYTNQNYNTLFNLIGKEAVEI